MSGGFTARTMIPQVSSSPNVGHPALPLLLPYPPPQLIATLPEALLRNEGMAEWAEGFIPMRLHALIRFGQWRTILAEPLPADPDLCVELRKST